MSTAKKQPQSYFVLNGLSFFHTEELQLKHNPDCSFAPSATYEHSHSLPGMDASPGPCSELPPASVILWRLSKEKNQRNSVSEGRCPLFPSMRQVRTK